MMITSTDTEQVDDLASMVSSMLSDVRTKKKDNIAASNANPLTPIWNNPWVLQGLHLIQTSVRCQHCDTITLIPHGLSEHYTHKTKNDTWDTVVTYTGKEHLPDAPFLGIRNVGETLVNGCGDCVYELLEANHE